MIRSALPQDAAAIASVHHHSWKETYPGLISQRYLDGLDLCKRTAQWEGKLAKGSQTVFVAEQSGAIVGFSSGGAPQQPELGFASELYAIYLLQAAQGTGLGRALFERLADAMRSKGHRDMYCWVVRGNPTAAFYRRMGGEQRQEKAVEIGGTCVVEDLFLWQLAFIRATN